MGANQKKKLSKLGPHSNRFIYTLLFLSVSCALINSFLIDKHLSADGVNYFYIILDSKDFINISWSRQFANYLTEWPLVLGVRLGITDIPILIKLFAIGIYFPYVVSFAVCIYAVRRENNDLLLFPLVSIVGINLLVDYRLGGEHLVMTLLSWPILLLSLRRATLTWVDGFLLWILLILFSGTFETAIIPAIIFFAIFAVRLNHNIKSKKEVVIFGISLLLSILTVIISLYFIINPIDITNRASFIPAIIETLRNPFVWAVISFTFLFTVGLILRNNYCILLSVVPVAINSLIFLFGSHGLTAGESFSCRTLTVTLLPFLLICSIAFRYYNVQQNKISAWILIVFVLVSVVGNIRFSNDWKTFRQQVVEIVTREKGYIPVEETMIKDSPYQWGWNNTELGLVWSYPCVRAILLNSPNIRWEPFNPREILVLKSYLRYDNFFKHVDSNITTCN
jgi:hypothetical protein